MPPRTIAASSADASDEFSTCVVTNSAVGSVVTSPAVVLCSRDWPSVSDELTVVFSTVTGDSVVPPTFPGPGSVLSVRGLLGLPVDSGSAHSDKNELIDHCICQINTNYIYTNINYIYNYIYSAGITNNDMHTATLHSTAKYCVHWNPHT